MIIGKDPKSLGCQFQGFMLIYCLPDIDEKCIYIIFIDIWLDEQKLSHYSIYQLIDMKSKLAIKGH